jgi:hypothetical protein
MVGCKITRRNPFPPQFDVKTVHEIIAQVTGGALGVYATKKVIDAATKLTVMYLKFKFMTLPKVEHSRQMTVTTPKKKVYKIKDKGDKPKNPK